MVKPIVYELNTKLLCKYLSGNAVIMYTNAPFKTKKRLAMPYHDIKISQI